MERDVKNILSTAGWTSNNNAIERRKALKIALERESLTSLIAALKWVERKFDRVGPESGIADICRNDIVWLGENYIQDKNGTRRITAIEKDDEKIKKTPPFKGEQICKNCSFKARYKFLRCPECNRLQEEEKK